MLRMGGKKFPVTNQQLPIVICVHTYVHTCDAGNHFRRGKHWNIPAFRSRSRGFDLFWTWDGWDELGRVVGRVEHRDRPMFSGLGTTGRLKKGVRVWVLATRQIIPPLHNFASGPPDPI